MSPIVARFKKIREQLHSAGSFELPKRDQVVVDPDQIDIVAAILVLAERRD